MKLVELKAQEFEKFAVKMDCINFLQSIEMKKRYDQKRLENYLFGVKQGQKIVAAGLVVTTRKRLGSKIFKCAGGPLLDYDAKNAEEILQFWTEAVSKTLKEKGGLVLEISPNVVSQPRDRKNKVVSGKDHLEIRDALEKQGYKYLGEYEQVKWGYVLPLKGKTAEEIFADFRTVHRQRIGYAKRDKVRIRELKDNELDILKRIAKETGERYGFQDPNLQYYREMKAAFGDKVKFMVSEAEIDGKMTPLTAAMFVEYGGEIVYLYSGSVRKYQKLSGAHLMQWHMIQEAIKQGCKQYNFYGVRPVEGDGVYLFKQGFRGHVQELLGTFMLPLNWKGKLYTCKQKYHKFGNCH